MPEPDAPLPEEGRRYSLRLNALHTGESLDIVYRIGDTYLPAALDKLNYLLRDRHTDEVNPYDPKEFDLLHNVLARLGRPAGQVDIVCGYRSPETNEALREQSANSGVAEHSQHIQARAIDIRVPGVPTARLRNAALSLEAGGVGYYPVSQFVHVDVGPVRTWTFAPVKHRRGHGKVRHAEKLKAGSRKQEAGNSEIGNSEVAQRGDFRIASSLDEALATSFSRLLALRDNGCCEELDRDLAVRTPGARTCARCSIVGGRGSVETLAVVKADGVRPLRTAGRAGAGGGRSALAGRDRRRRGHASCAPRWDKVERASMAMCVHGD